MKLSYKRLRLRPVGADGSAVASGTVVPGKSGILMAIGIDYQNQPATTDILIKDGAGHTIFTRTSSATDIAWSPCARPGVDEGGAASSGTDQPGFPFHGGLTVTVAEADGQTSGDELIAMEFLVLVND